MWVRSTQCNAVPPCLLACLSECSGPIQPRTHLRARRPIQADPGGAVDSASSSNTTPPALSDRLGASCRTRMDGESNE